MAVPAFKTVTGPLATDLGDGATGYNAVAAATEANFPLFNTWGTAAEAARPVSTPVITGTSAFTPGSGWAFEGYSHRETWARKWGGLVYVSVAVKRTGATLPAGNAGNLGDTLVGTVAAGYRPPATHYTSAACGAGVWLIYTNTYGEVKIYAASESNAFRSGQVLLWCMLYPNPTPPAPF